MHDNNTLLKYSGFFKWLSFSLLTSSFVVLVLNIIADWSFPPRIDLAGVKNLFSNFEPTIKIFTYFLGTFAIWLTLSRMFQTKEQLKIIEENNRFNNYFKHREQFVIQFKDNIFFKEFETLTKRSAEPNLLDLYYSYYYKSHHNFTPFMNKDANNLVYNFMNSVEKSKINIENFNLNEITIDELIKLTSKNDSNVRKYISSMNSYLTTQMKVRLILNEVERSLTTEKISKFIYLNEIYWSGIFYNSLRAFDGNQSLAWENFPVNFINYREEVYYDDARNDRVKTA